MTTVLIMSAVLHGYQVEVWGNSDLRVDLRCNLSRLSDRM